MEIILKEDVIGLGYKNDIVNVKPGYGRNYLIPTGKGIIASPSAKKVLAENLRQQAHKLATQKAAAEKKAEGISGVSLVIAVKVSSTGTTYGSVNTTKVAEELAKLGHEVDRKLITMRDIKAIGDYVATVHLHKEVTVEIPIKVIDEKSLAVKKDTQEEAVAPQPSEEQLKKQEEQTLEDEIEEYLESKE